MGYGCEPANVDRCWVSIVRGCRCSRNPTTYRSFARIARRRFDFRFSISTPINASASGFARVASRAFSMAVALHKSSISKSKSNARRRICSAIRHSMHWDGVASIVNRPSIASSAHSMGASGVAVRAVAIRPPSYRRAKSKTSNSSRSTTWRSRSITGCRRRVAASP